MTLKWFVIQTLYPNLACKNKMTVGSNESGIKQRKFKLIQVPSQLFRPSDLDSIILEEISNEKEPTCFVDGLRSDIKGLTFHIIPATL